jgi:hypothetical protein
VDAAAGKMDVVSDTVSELTGYQPQTLVDFFADTPRATSTAPRSTSFRDLPADLRRDLQEGQPEAASARIVEASGVPSADRRQRPTIGYVLRIR